MLTPKEDDQLDRWLTREPDDEEPEDDDNAPDRLEDLGDEW